MLIGTPISMSMICHIPTGHHTATTAVQIHSSQVSLNASTSYKTVLVPLYGHYRTTCIIVTCRSALAMSIACCFTAAVARIPDARTPTPRNRTVAYLSSRGRRNRCFCRRELITIVTPLRRPGSANMAASVCLYIGNKKDHCSQPR